MDLLRISIQAQAQLTSYQSSPSWDILSFHNAVVTSSAFECFPIALFLFLLDYISEINHTFNIIQPLKGAFIYSFG